MLKRQYSYGAYKLPFAVLQYLVTTLSHIAKPVSKISGNKKRKNLKLGVSEIFLEVRKVLVKAIISKIVCTNAS